MFRTIFVAALVAALCAGFVSSAFQAWRLAPLIATAESFETEGGHAHDHNGVAAHAHDGDTVAAHSHDGAAAPVSDAPAGHVHDGGQWMPQDGFERTAYTVLANILLAAGYGLIIGAISILFSLPISFANGLLWGLGGFAAFSLAPALGLPPGMPGMPVADLAARQFWWAGAALATGAALVLAAKIRAPWALALAVGLIVLPHLIAAPQAPDAATAVPPRLAAEFVAAVLYNGAIFWAVLGLTFGRVNDYLAARSAGATRSVPA